MASSDEPRQGCPLRVVLLGMPCGFTRNVLDAAITCNADEHAFDLRAIVLAGRQAERSTGWPAGVPVRIVSSRTAFTSPACRNRIAALAPDVIVAACFPWRVPQAIRDIPRFGCLNVHPSLLPDGRGPEPVFWAFHRGLRRTGVTIHRMDDGLDTGPILAQHASDIAANATITTLEVDLATAGGRILHGVIRDLAAGTARERVQPPGKWPDAPFPSRHDLIATTEWSATHVASFIRAVAPVHGPVSIRIAETGRNLPRPTAPGDVVAADDGATQVDALAWDGDTVRIRCTPGVVTVRMSRPSFPLMFEDPNAP